MANSPLNHNTLASVKTWGIQQELVICHCKGKKLFCSLQMDLEKRQMNTLRFQHRNLSAR
jgi:hypothetical protein